MHFKPLWIAPSLPLPQRKPSPPPFKCVTPPHVIIIGGGAAGFFTAITLSRRSSASITILESLPHVLSKVRISGGGRCNVTSGLHHDDPLLFSANYPRGSRAMPSILSRYNARDIMHFFESEGVPLKIEQSGKVFPVSDSSETVVNALVAAARRGGVRIRTAARVLDVKAGGEGFDVVLKGWVERAEFVVVATGGGKCGWKWARGFGHDVVRAVPSLFTLRVHDEALWKLAGVSVPDCVVRLGKGRGGLEQRGAVLITHWGLSGPAVLALSAFGARVLNEEGYRMKGVVDWVPALGREEVGRVLNEARKRGGGRKVGSLSVLGLPKRLWAFLGGGGRWGEVGKEGVRKLVERVKGWEFEVEGRGGFKEEFVTAGGVRLKEVDVGSFESRKRGGVFFVGEVLDVDGMTGGFNLGFAWSSGFIAGCALSERVEGG